MFITLLSLFSFSNTDLPSVKIPYIDKLVHFTFYGIATLLGVLSLKEHFTLKKVKTVIVWYLVVVLVGYGIIIEILQDTITVTRSAEFLDFVANTIGVFIGLFIAKQLFLKERILK
ncbi:VanZ family protein [Cellulophaga omnivescoria]|uniref:VanZ family protein n=1 Tax=Cellulophaga omnivescoria TaxID=1888890 RepID=UPI0015C55309|nr:VanZ family protein [Cellulophaga omnivescoria]WBU88071.1 VanZ family protein [Cellulophaga omnivescoria]WKB80051.1 VanZ family protein [Cellulophaga lytica]